MSYHIESIAAGVLAGFYKAASVISFGVAFIVGMTEGVWIAVIGSVTGIITLILQNHAQNKRQMLQNEASNRRLELLLSKTGNERKEAIIKKIEEVGEKADNAYTAANGLNGKIAAATETIAVVAKLAAVPLPPSFGESAENPMHIIADGIPSDCPP